MRFSVLLVLSALFSSARAFSHFPLGSVHALVTAPTTIRREARERKPTVALATAGRRGPPPLQSSSTAPSFSNETASAFSFARGGDILSAGRKEQLTLLFRSSFCALSSVATWAMVQQTGMTIVQASAIQGLLGCLLLSKPYAMAWFCGSFAGMSAQPTVLGEASLLAAACTGVFYQFEANKLALGRGGRLGLIAFLSNLVYYVICQGPRQTIGLVVDLVDQIRPGAAVGVAVLGAVLAGMRARSAKLAIESPSMRHRVVKLSAQSVLLMLLCKRMATLGVSTWSLATTFAATFIPAVLAWKSQYTIFPVALLGVMAGFLAPSFGPAVYMGGFIGMTGLANFRTSKFARAAALSAVLLKCGILVGFGGRLGFLAYLGVNFAI